MVLTRTHGIDKDSGINKDLLYRQGLIVLTSPMVLTKTHGIVLVVMGGYRWLWVVMGGYVWLWLVLGGCGWL